MFKSKWKLILGLFLLILGIVIKLLSDQDVLAIILIVIGALLKTAHIIGIIKTKAYQPGLEFLVLVIGLSVFFFGLYVCQKDSLAQLFIISGLILKTIFVVWFIRKLNK